MTKCQTIFKRESGYTLIQMAIAILILGLLSTAAIQLYTVYTAHEKLTKNQILIEDAVKKIQTYRQVYGHYPCPAPMDAARTDAGYGRSTDCTDTSIAIGSCSGGICIQRTNRAIDDDGDPMTPDVLTDLRVRVGAIPFRELQMEEKESFDSYGSRITYALTERMGNSSTFKETQGGIEIHDDQGQQLTDPPGSASFILVSHGPNRKGAYDGFSGNQQACGTTGADLENCVDTSSPPTDAIFVSSLMYDGTSAANYDDTVQFFATAANPLWRRTTSASEDIVDMSDKNVGIGMNAPTDELTVTQSTVNASTGVMMTTNSTAANANSGALRANNFMADTYCDETGTNCFQSKDFMGDPGVGTGGMECPAGTYMVGITSDGTNAVPDCEPVRNTCTGSNVLVGLNADGSPNCQPVAASCPVDTTSFNICGSSISLPAAGSGGYSPVYSGGDCRQQQYKCNNGTWTPVYNSGYCTKTTYTGVSCAAGYTGTYTYDNCGGTTAPTDCTCAGVGPYPKAVLCTSPFTGGSQTQTCQQICVGNVLQPETCGPLTGSCSCSKGDDWAFDYCPGGFVRDPSPTPASFTSPAKSWPADTTKGKYRKLTIDTSTCSYDNPSWDDLNCICDGKPKYDNVMKTPASYPVLYPGPAACWQKQAGNRDVYDGVDLAKSAVTWEYAVTRTPKDASCNYDFGSVTTLSEAKFVPRQHYWRRLPGARSNASVETTTLGNPEADSTCDCQSQVGSTSLCAVAVAGGYDFYSCKCDP